MPTPTPGGKGTTVPALGGDPAPAKNAIYLIHTDGALPLSGPRGVVELTTATPKRYHDLRRLPSPLLPAGRNPRRRRGSLFALSAA